MDQDLAKGALGSVGDYDLAFQGGKLVGKVDLNLPALSGTLNLSLDAGKVLDALAKAVPGSMDDVLIALLKKALGI